MFRHQLRRYFDKRRIGLSGGATEPVEKGEEPLQSRNNDPAERGGESRKASDQKKKKKKKKK